STCSNLTVRVGLDDDGNQSLEARESITRNVCIPPAGNVTAVEGRVGNVENRVTAVEGLFQNGTPLMISVDQNRPPDGVTRFDSLDAALASLRARRKSQSVRIVIEPGTYVFSDPVLLNDLDGALIEISGPDAVRPTLQFNNSDGFILPSGFSFGLLRNLRIESSNPSGQNRRGLIVEAGSHLNVENLEFVNFTYGVEVIGGRLTRNPELERSGLFAVKSIIIRCPANPAFTVGYWIRDGATVSADNSEVHSCFFGYWVQNGSAGLFDGSLADGNLLGFFADHHSLIQAGVREDEGGALTTVRNSREAGYSANNLSEINAIGWVPPPAAMANVSDFAIGGGSLMRVVEDLAAFPPVNCGLVMCDPTAIIRGCTAASATCGTEIR
ncbi:MAG: hypothetical protein AAFU79_24890, partial [Myxococcota bacterium]